MYACDREREDGFTLVELMVVVLIIGVLVAIAIPVFASAKESVEQRTCFTSQRAIEGASQQWLAADPARAADDLAGVVDNAHPLIPGFISKAPHCPNLPGFFYTLGVDATVEDCPNGSLGPHGHF